MVFLLKGLENVRVRVCVFREQAETTLNRGQTPGSDGEVSTVMAYVLEQQQQQLRNEPCEKGSETPGGWEARMRASPAHGPKRRETRRS